MEEKLLIKECINRDIKAFEKLILNYEAKIYNMCFYLLKNREDALDASQEVCIKIYKSIEKFKGESKFATWVYRITYNTCMDLLKKRKNEFSYDDVIDYELHREDRIESIIESRELKYDLKESIMKLNDDYRMIIILRDIEGLSYQEISEILNIESGTVKSRLFRAREALRNELIKRGVLRR